MSSGQDKGKIPERKPYVITGSKYENNNLKIQIYLHKKTAPVFQRPDRCGFKNYRISDRCKYNHIILYNANLFEFYFNNK